MIGFLVGLVVGVPFNPLKVELLPGAERTTQGPGGSKC